MAPGRLSHHGARTPRGLQAPPRGAPGRGRFGRMFPYLPVRDLGEDAIDALLKVMRRRDPVRGENDGIPAGFTYLGQFIDHDITFDPTSLLDKVNDPFALSNFRTPRLDLDSLYGSGPADQPFLYEWDGTGGEGVRFLLGTSPGGVRDLQRNAQGIAVTGDPRNDENLIISQLHLLFMRFHNAVVDFLAPQQLTGKELFREAQRIVRWHYQWIVVHDYMRRVVGATTADSVLKPGVTQAEVELRCFTWDGEPYIPVEFSGAAFRFGHSMVRASYALNANRHAPILSRAENPSPLKHLAGFRFLPAPLEIDWSFFFTLPGREAPQSSFHIDMQLEEPLRKLPTSISATRDMLARLNLRRGLALELPAGRDVARATGATALGDEQLLPRRVWPDRVADEVRETLLRATPLWYYVLCEAAILGKGKHLGPVGGRIVAEVLVGLLQADPNSYLRQWPAWRPELPGGRDGDFTMADLVQFTEASPSARRVP